MRPASSVKMMGRQSPLSFQAHTPGSPNRQGVFSSYSVGYGSPEQMPNLPPFRSISPGRDQRMAMRNSTSNVDEARRAMSISPARRPISFELEEGRQHAPGRAVRPQGEVTATRAGTSQGGDAHRKMAAENAFLRLRIEELERQAVVASSAERRSTSPAGNQALQGMQERLAAMEVALAAERRKVGELQERVKWQEMQKEKRMSELRLVHAGRVDAMSKEFEARLEDLRSQQKVQASITGQTLKHEGDDSRRSSTASDALPPLPRVERLGGAAVAGEQQRLRLEGEHLRELVTLMVEETDASKMQKAELVAGLEKLAGTVEVLTLNLEEVHASRQELTVRLHEAEAKLVKARCEVMSSNQTVDELSGQRREREGAVERVTRNYFEGAATRASSRCRRELAKASMAAWVDLVKQRRMEGRAVRGFAAMRRRLGISCLAAWSAVSKWRTSSARTCRRIQERRRSLQIMTLMSTWADLVVCTPRGGTVKASISFETSSASKPSLAMADMPRGSAASSPSSSNRKRSPRVLPFVEHWPPNDIRRSHPSPYGSQAGARPLGIDVRSSSTTEVSTRPRLDTSPLSTGWWPDDHAGDEAQRNYASLTHPDEHGDESVRTGAEADLHRMLIKFKIGQPMTSIYPPSPDVTDDLSRAVSPYNLLIRSRSAEC